MVIFASRNLAIFVSEFTYHFFTALSLTVPIYQFTNLRMYQIATVALL